MTPTRQNAPLTVARGAALILAGLLVARLLNYAYRIVLARSGGMAEFGVLFLAISTIVAAGSLVTLGLDYGTARFVPLYLEKDDKAGLRASLRYSLLFALAAGTAGGVLLHLISPWIAGWLLAGPELVPALYLCAWCLPFYVAGRVLIKAVVAFQKIEYRVSVYQVFNPLLKLSLTLVLLAFGMGAVGALWAYLAAEASSSLALWVILERRVFRVFTGRREPRESGFSPRAFLAYSLPLFLAGIIDLVLGYTDAFMTGHFLDSARVGLYGAAATLASLTALGTELLNPMFLSIITREYALGNNTAIVSTYNNNNRWFMYLTLPVAILTVCLSGRLMSLIWGPDFAAGASALTVLCLGRFMYSLENTSVLVLSMHGAGTFLLVTNLGVAGLNVLLNWILIPVLGIEGAALGTAISLGLHAGLALVGARLYHRGQGMRVLFPRVLVAAVLPGATVWGLDVWLAPGWTTLVAMGLVYMVLYAALLKLFRVFSEEDRLIWRTLRDRLRGSGPDA